MRDIRFMVGVYTNNEVTFFIDQQEAEKWKEKQPNKDKLKVQSCEVKETQGQKKPLDLKNIYCVFDPDPHSQIK